MRSTPRYVRSWRSSRNATAGAAPPSPRSEQQYKETSARRGRIAPEIERLGVERARLLADNIELERKGALLAERIGQAQAAGEPPGGG